MQAGTQTDKHTRDIQIGMQVDRQTGRASRQKTDAYICLRPKELTNVLKLKCAYKQTYRHTCRHNDRQAYLHVYRQAGIQTGRHTGRQAYS